MSNNMNIIFTQKKLVIEAGVEWTFNYHYVLSAWAPSQANSKSFWVKTNHKLQQINHAGFFFFFKRMKYNGTGRNSQKSNDEESALYSEGGEYKTIILCLFR